MLGGLKKISGFGSLRMPNQMGQYSNKCALSCSTLSFFILHGRKIILETRQEKELGQCLITKIKSKI